MRSIASLMFVARLLLSILQAAPSAAEEGGTSAGTVQTSRRVSADCSAPPGSVLVDVRNGEKMTCIRASTSNISNPGICYIQGACANGFLKPPSGSLTVNGDCRVQIVANGQAPCGCEVRIDP